MRRIFGAALLVASAACAKQAQGPSVQTATVSRRDVIVNAVADGAIEPITIITVKSKASGVIDSMPVEVGTHLNTGTLIAQVDTRDVQNKYDQAQAALNAAQAKLTVADSDTKRNEVLFKQRVITAQEYEQVAVNEANALSGVTDAKANLDLAKQALEDATVRAPSEGTVLDKLVYTGTVIASATGSVSGGTTLVDMADLTTVRIRALFNETDIGNVRPGEPTNVTIDAYPDRRFSGVVEQIEPEAVVQQNVTEFPVLVNLENQEGLLKPGMNGEVSVLIDEHDGVLAIPNDAIKNPREAVATGAMLGMSADTVNAELKAQGFNVGGRGGRGGNGGRRNGGAGGAGGRNGGGQGGGGGANGAAGGEVGLIQQGQGNGQQPQVADSDCKKVTDVLNAHPKEKHQLDSLRTLLAGLRPAAFNGGANGANGANGGGANGAGGANGGRRNRTGGFGGGAQGNGNGAGFGNGARAGGNGAQRQGRRAGGDSTQRGAGRGAGAGNAQMQAINTQMRAIYSSLGLDQRTAGQCTRRATGQFANAGGAGGANGASGAGDQGAGLATLNELNGRAPQTRAGLVFVADSSKTVFQPRIVQLGVANLDYTEVVSGLKEGDHVVMLGALALQAQRQANNARFAQNATPLGGGGPGGGRGGRGGF